MRFLRQGLVHLVRDRGTSEIWSIVGDLAGVGALRRDGGYESTGLITEQVWSKRMKYLP